MSKPKKNKGVRDLERQASPWVFSGFTGSGHIRFRHPGLDITYVTSATPSDHRSSLNALRDMRRLSGSNKRKSSLN